MLCNRSFASVADNSGAKIIRCLSVLGGTKKLFATVGDTIVVAVRVAIPGSKLKRGDVRKAVVVAVRAPVKRRDGSCIRFDRNAVVIIDDDGSPVGTRIMCPVARELRKHGFYKILSLAREVR